MSLGNESNFSLTGLYVNANHVLVFEDANVAAHYGEVFEKSWLVLKENHSPSKPAAVAFSGLIGFVGIIVPHAIRLVLGPSYRLIVPLSLLVGGGFLVLADVIARSIISPAELPMLASARPLMRDVVEFAPPGSITARGLDRGK